MGGYGSGREIYVFKVPGTESYLPGDINNDGKIDRNDLTSYINYTGLRKGDSDFEGYISNGDINRNGLIDAYDISVVATQLEDDSDHPQEDAGQDKGDAEEKKDATEKKKEELGGKLLISADKKRYAKGDIAKVTVKGQKLSLVNALSFALPYDPKDYEFVGVEPLNLKAMENPDERQAPYEWRQGLVSHLCQHRRQGAGGRNQGTLCVEIQGQKRCQI